VKTVEIFDLTIALVVSVFYYLYKELSSNAIVVLSYKLHFRRNVI